MTIISKCPKCNGQIEATVKFYLDGVTVNSDGTIKDFEIDSNLMGMVGVQSNEDVKQAIRGFIGEGDPSEVQIYCENDHDFADFESEVR